MSDMKSTLKGVVRDHRMPRDYKFHFAQPSNSAVWWKNLNRYFVVRQMTKQNVSLPLVTLLVCTPLSHLIPSDFLILSFVLDDCACILCIPNRG